MSVVGKREVAWARSQVSKGGERGKGCPVRKETLLIDKIDSSISNMCTFRGTYNHPPFVSIIMFSTTMFI